MRPLEGLLVVSIDQAVAAPLCAARLADAGARVIKVERPEGDFARNYDRAVRGLSSGASEPAPDARLATYFVWLNRGKESIALDLKDPEDAALLSRMVARADIFIQNLGPGIAARLGFGSHALRASYPRLITVDISGYGETGPYADMKAYDLLIQAETGLASITGRAEGPGRVGVSVCDIAAGMYAYEAVLEALILRSHTDRGTGIAVSLFDALADWMSVPLLQYEGTGVAPARVGLNHPSIAPYGAYGTGDGGAVVLSIQNEREWVRFCTEVLGQPDLASDPRFNDPVRRVENRSALNTRIAEIFGRLDRSEVQQRLRNSRIAFGTVNEIEDLAAHPQLRRCEVETPIGPVRIVAPPARVDANDRPLGPVPALNAHGAALRREFS